GSGEGGKSLLSSRAGPIWRDRRLLRAGGDSAVVSGKLAGNRYNKTFDTTSNKRFTLSDQTQKLVRNLKGDATITYIDKSSGFESARGMLDRYKNLSPKIHIQYIDYQKQPTVARAYGLRFPGTAYVELGS